MRRDLITSLNTAYINKSISSRESGGEKAGCRIPVLAKDVERKEGTR
jgi:hypothetical protein